MLGTAEKKTADTHIGGHSSILCFNTEGCVGRFVIRARGVGGFMMRLKGGACLKKKKKKV